MSLIDKAMNTIKKYSMFRQGDGVLIGLSGGPDSVCLSVILDEVRDNFNLSLHAVYVDHGLRPDETPAEIEFCRDFCRKLEIDFRTRSADTRVLAKREKLNVQEAARESRYRIFTEVAEEVNAGRIAVGHTADDQAETVLMRLLRGAGRKGLAGIPPVRGKIIRPLIEIERKDIEAFLASQNAQTFLMDSSNVKNDYFRNWVRQTIMPEVKTKNPELISGLCRTAEILKEEDDYLELIVTKALMKLISRKSGDTIELFLVPLETVERPIVRRILRRVIDEIKGLRGLEYMHVEDIINLIKSGTSGSSLNLPGGVRAVKEYALLKITTQEPVKISEYLIDPPCEITIQETQDVIKASFEEKDSDLGDDRSSVLLDAGDMHFPLTVRSRRDGDFFFPRGFGKRKKIHDFFIDDKIPRYERDAVPLVLSGNDIVWVAGYRADHRFRVTDRTEKCLRLIISKRKS